MLRSRQSWKLLRAPVWLGSAEVLDAPSWPVLGVTHWLSAPAPGRCTPQAGYAQAAAREVQGALPTAALLQLCLNTSPFLPQAGCAKLKEHPQLLCCCHCASTRLDSSPRLDVRKQRREKLKEFSKLVARWSELTVQEHEWYLAHQGERFVQLTLCNRTSCSSFLTRLVQEHE